MPVSNLNIWEQRRVIGALARTVALAGLKKPPKAPTVPGPEIRATVPPPSDRVAREFVRLIGGEPSAYGKSLPPHLFPQWSFPVVLRALEAVPYPPARIVNAGCTLDIAGKLPKGEPLNVTARLAEIDDNGRRALITVNVTTGTPSAPNVLSAAFRMLVPLSRGDKAKSERPRIPGDAREVARLRFRKDTGLDFAKVTGDFNPIHWLPRYAKAMGFRSVILHGFGSMAFCVEALHKNVFAGNVNRIKTIDANFVRALNLPGRAGLYLWDDGQFGLGVAAGGPAYLLGSYVAR